jgi:hypothetical protein
MTRNSRRATRIAERRILRDYLRRGSSSPAFEELQQKYPNYRGLARRFLEIITRAPQEGAASYRGTFGAGVSTEAHDWMRRIGLLEKRDLFRGKTHRESRRGIRKVVRFGGADNRRGDEGFA